MKRVFFSVVCLAVVGLLAGFVGAQDKPGVVSNVKILSDKVEDVTTLKDWEATYIKPDMSDHDKMIAIWKTVTRYRHQTEPPNEFLAGLGGANVHDPMKTIHVYGYGMCCCAASNVEGLARYLGYKARGRAINQHSVPEVFYADAWHMIDGSVMNYFINDDGSIASVDDIRAAVRGWWRDHPEEAKAMRGNDAKIRAWAKDENWKKNGPPLLARCETYTKDGANEAGWHGWMSTMQEYDWSDEKAYIDDYGPQMGYGVNVQLRVGEKLTRNWSNKGLHVNMPGKMPVDGRDGLGLQKKLGDVAPGRIGNGVLEYNVPLATNEFRKGALVAENLASKAEGAASAVAVKDAATDGVLVVRMPSSYVYLTGKVELKAVVGAGGSIVVSFSDNQGLDFKEVQKIETAGDVTINLSPLVLRRYDYRLKFEMKGAGTGLDALKITHDVQHSQAPLPAVLEGKNTITFEAGPQEGTITYEGCTSEKSEAKQVLMTDYHPVIEGLTTNHFTVGGTGKGSATWTLTTPGDMTRIRFNAYWRARDAKDGWTADVSFDEGQTWTKIDTLPGPIKGDSKYVVFDKVPAGTRKALLRFSGTQRNTTCLFNLALYADYVEPNGGFRPVKVTYVWTENGADKTDVHVAQQPKDQWTIDCAAGAVPKSYTVELAD